MSTQLTETQIQQAWNTIFPKSLININVFSDTSLYVTCYLAGDITEWANRISHNDVLSYVFKIDGTTYKENCASIVLQVRPEDKFYAFSREVLRKKTIKNLDENKLIARFKEIYAFVTKFKDEFPNQYKDLFDINEKLGL